VNKRFAIPKLRWFIAGLLLAVTLINYVDRLTVSVLVGEIRQGLNLSETDYAQVISIFLAAYAVMYGVSGYLLDRLGTRTGMAVFVCFWSACQILHGLAVGKWSFAACRFGLGLAEPGSFPAATKAIGEWFPARQRAIGVGIFNTGSVLGAALSAPLVASVAMRLGWRAAFVFTGALGFLWLILWLIFYEAPPRNRWLDPREAAELDLQNTATETPAAKLNWLKVLSSRAGIMLVLARFLTDPVIYFLMFWLPA
jgi:MFS transporter, ACS family, hexuronate transporter